MDFPNRAAQTVNGGVFDQICELSSGPGRRHRLGAGRRGAMETAGSHRTSSPEGQDDPDDRQIQRPEIIALQHNATIYPPWAQFMCFKARPAQRLRPVPWQWGQNLVTGISIILTKGVDFHNPDPILAARLQERISAEGELLQDFWPFPPLYKGYNKRVRYNI